MSEIKTFKDIIQLWEKDADFGRDIGVDNVHACTMKRRNSIPCKYWPRVIMSLHKRGFINITYETLAKIASKKRRKIKER